jgi:hypothetical protein
MFATISLAALCTLVAAFQQRAVPIQLKQTDPCRDGKKLAASIPQGILISLNKAVERSDFEEVVRIARQPRSGLKVASLCRDKEGKIASYTIINRDGCTVAIMDQQR